MSVLAIAQESLSDIFVGEPREECGVVVKKWQRSLGIVGCALKTLGGIELRQSVSLHSVPPLLILLPQPLPVLGLQAYITASGFLKDLSRNLSSRETIDRQEVQVE